MKPRLFLHQYIVTQNAAGFSPMLR